MIQKELYTRDISIDIDGVVKATDLDDNTLYNEIKEYVLTNELMQPNMLPRLFEEMSMPNFGKSIWISGHFGSGKSHLLKMLSIVMADKQFETESAAELFASKGDIDFEFATNIKRTCSYLTESLLFNIQSKSDGITSSTTDPVLAIFSKVYNEHLGYSDNPKIADFERYLDIKGEYTKFKELYQTTYSENWIDGRKRLMLTTSKAASIFAQLEGISEENARDGIRDSVKNYTLDINSFAEIIKEYIDTKPSGFRLIFCVDEVGQFIANDINKMLSLQSIAEDLSSKTGGRAFMIVTSQNDLNATVGDLKKEQKNDFSKIAGRFAFKIALTSANADEVIQKRLLSKTAEGESALSKIYDKEENNLRTILKFDGDTPFNIKYKDKEHFINSYPFTAYQFELLKASITALNDYNAFIGGHQSLGERSMLSICQKVVQNYANKDIESIISFSSMYDGISEMLQSNVITNISLAAKNIDSFSLDVLKTLFLTKYEKRISTTVDNIAILMLPAFDTDLLALKKQIQEALNLLEQNVYIQRTAAGVYEFLTNQEKDIEQEIRNTIIDGGVVRKHLSDLLFSELYSLPKITVGDSKYNIFSYSKKCDETLISKDEEIALHFITPLCQNEIVRKNPNNFLVANPSDLIVYMSEDSKLEDEIRFYEQTKKYTGTTTSDSNDQLKEIILADKRVKNQERKRIITEKVNELLSGADLYIMGSALTISKTQNFKDRITTGMIQLVGSVYTSHRLLQTEYSEKSIADVLKSSDSVLIDTDTSEAEVEVINKLMRNKNSHERTTIKQLLTHFKSRPFGWYENAVLTLIAQLYKRGKISFKRDSVILSDDEISKSLLNSRLQDTTIIEVDEEIHSAQVVKFKKFYQEYFGKSCTVTEAREISNLFVAELKIYKTKIENYYGRKKDLKFLNSLSEPISYISALSAKSHPYFIANLSEFEDRLLDDKEDLLDKITGFMEGAQLSIFEKVGTHINSNSPNLDYLKGGSLEKLQYIFNSNTPYSGSLMQEAKTHLDALCTEITTLQENERAKAIKEITEQRELLIGFDDFEKLSEVQKQELLSEFNTVEIKVQGERYIGNIRDRATYIKGDYYSSCLDMMSNWIELSEQKASDKGSTELPPHIPRKVFIKRDSVKVIFTKPALETKEDVEIYMDKLKTRYLEIIKEDKKISL